MTLLALVVAGGVGAVLRDQLGRVLGRRRGINWANRIGCLALGVLLGAEGVGVLAPWLLGVLGTGLCGGLTTFSTLMVTAAQDDPGDRARLLGREVVVGMVLVVAGLAIGSHLG